MSEFVCYLCYLCLYGVSIFKTEVLGESINNPNPIFISILGTRTLNCLGFNSGGLTLPRSYIKSGLG